MRAHTLCTHLLSSLQVYETPIVSSLFSVCDCPIQIIPILKHEPSQLFLVHVFRCSLCKHNCLFCRHLLMLLPFSPPSSFAVKFLHKWFALLIARWWTSRMPYRPAHIILCNRHRQSSFSLRMCRHTRLLVSCTVTQITKVTAQIFALQNLKVVSCHSTNDPNYLDTGRFLWHMTNDLAVLLDSYGEELLWPRIGKTSLILIL